MRAYIYMCVCVYIYVYLYICVPVCVYITYALDILVCTVAGCSWAGSRKSWTGSPMGVGESWTGSPMEPPEKGRQGHTFSHTERASVATIYLSDRMHWICDAYAKYMRIYNYKIPVSNGLLVDAYAKHMLSIYPGDTVAQPTLYKTLGVCLVYVQHMQHIYILYTIIT